MIVNEFSMIYLPNHLVKAGTSGIVGDYRRIG